MLAPEVTYTVNRRSLLFVLFLLALAGLLLHVRIHYFMVPDKLHPGALMFDETRFYSCLFPLIDVVVVTILFSSRRTAVYGYLLNGLIVIYGTIFMAHFSVADLIRKGVPPLNWLLQSTFPDICIAWVDFFVGKALYDLYVRKV